MVNNRRYKENMYDVNQTKCIPQEMVIENVRLAAGYVPYQQMCELFDPIDALKKGTAFPELFSPYDKRDKNYKSYKFCDNK